MSIRLMHFLDQQFVRRNSLLPDRISGRKSSRHLKRKKKVTLHRVEHTDVTVELLSGRHVEVSCRSDAVASEIADVVMRHLNFTENSFFGLTVLRDGEHFFLDGHQRLEKFAPPGWKNARQRGLSKRSYMLFLRFRYYPASLAFIRTEVVLHELYLQLRRDILDDRILPKRELLYTLAALAMQSEYSDQPNAKISDYFDAQYYIPKRYMDSRDKKAVIQDLVEKHGKYRGMKQIDLTQRLSDYGAHLYRVFTSKPSINLGNIPFGDPQTGVAQWIGIMARGIVIFEEESDGRHAQTEYLWQNTQTLQFDKKRFVIVSEIHEPSTNVFYTNHYSKSSYFVRFAASQHRFMIKMRQWNHTLRHDSPFQFHKVPDVGADTDLIKEVTVLFYLIVTKILVALYLLFVQKGDNYDDEISVDPLSENVDGYVLEISLKKDPSTGLGLTLVDGNLNGVKGVYVKSVSEGGAGREGVMNVGDRLVSVNDVSLVGKDRHATVDLVKQCSDIVHLKILRLEALSSSLVTGIANKGVLNDQKKDNHSFSVSSKGTRSRTPPPSRKHPHVLKKRTRAISDFGAVGDTLPDLNSEDLLANLKKSLSNERVEQRMDYDMTVASMYKFEDVDDDVTEHSVQHSAIVPYCVFKSHESGWLGSEKSDVDQQKIILHRNELGSLGFQIASSAGIVYVKQITAEPALSCPNISVGDKIIMVLALYFVNHKRVENMAHQDVVDLIRKSGDKVAICLEHIDKEMIALDDDEQTIRVVLEKSTTGSLGLSLAKKTGYDGIYIRMISSGSAADIDGTLHIGDRIWKVNGDSVSSHTPGAIVDLLKAASNPVEIVVKRTINK
ncbi:unnamed protein product [Thelazia callipaeda]|uniref:FERM and PDZ domain-containing protein 2 n=1 Tax=Thelazia callipaeda TaxID=103827 RepID=A0A158RC39_THECL|nr:unnamed protein product [Thelazia callipaeda]